MFSHQTLNFHKKVERILVIHLHHQGHQYLVLTPEIQYRRGSFLIEIEPKLFNLLWQTSSHIELERERQKNKQIMTMMIKCLLQKTIKQSIICSIYQNLMSYYSHFIIF